MADAPERIWAVEIGTATKGGQSFRIGRWITDETASHSHEYIRADVARADAELAVAEAIRRAADEADKHYANGDMGNPGHWILALALAPADALAEVQRLREENDRLKSLLTPPDDVPWVTCDAIIHGSAALDRFSGDEPLVPADALNVARGERDAALARGEKLREAALGLKSIVEGIQGAMEHGTWRAERSNLRMKDTDEWVTFYNVLAALDEDARHG